MFTLFDYKCISGLFSQFEYLFYVYHNHNNFGYPLESI